ncbi:CHAT domain-containing protein, partial [Phormidium sp. CCY1219]|uniref:CHAT domain-containing protein n=1 Tax=Phormidium sp. CCY1219 TaxID=2886104 RepID=UPI002D1F240A
LLGLIYRTRTVGNMADNIEKAIAAHQLALTVYTKEKFTEKWANTQNYLGLAYCDRIQGDKSNNIEKSIAFHQQALTFFTKENNPEKWAHTQIYLGNAYIDRVLGKKLNNLRTSINYYQSALTVFTKKQYPDNWALCQNNLGEVYKNRSLGNHQENLRKALAACLDSLELMKKDEYPELWGRLNLNLGDIYIRLSTYQYSKDSLIKAKFYYEEGLKVFPKESNPERWATTQLCLTNVYEMKTENFNYEDFKYNLNKVVELSNNSLQVFTRSAFPENYVRALVNLGVAYLNSKKYQSAYNAFAEAVDTVEYLRGEIISGDEAKRKFNEEWIKPYVLMVETCIQLNRRNKALEYADRSKARNLTELIATRDAYPGGEIPAEIRQRLQQLRQEIAEEDRRLKQDPDPDYGHITQLREEFQAKYPYKPLAFQDIQSLLDDETAILEWYILGDKFLTFTITPNPPLTPPLEGGEPEPPFQRGAGGISLWQSSPEDFKTLIDWGNAYLNDYRRNKTQWQENLPQRLETLAQILHLDEILHNLRETFPTCKKLILIPHRFLHLFPIHALPVSNPQEGTSIAPLQELFPNGVSYAPNCQVLQQAQKRQQKRPNFNQLFAIQNPTKDLNFTDIEVEAIKNFFDPHHVLKHDEAEKTALDFHNAHCTHFSCHGYFNFEDALKSALILAKSEFAPPPPEDDPTRYIPLKNKNLLDLGKCLTIEDILRLDLTSCRLVTLSACETGITDFTSTSDEYIGLPSGFIMAGSPNVVSTLWTVNDLSSALLMIRFYQNLKNGETVPLALKHAQIWLRDATAEALQQWSSQLKLRSTYRQQLRRFSKMESTAKPFSSPYYWAGFCAIGA